jgi:hypothetical protein
LRLLLRRAIILHDGVRRKRRLVCCASDSEGEQYESVELQLVNPSVD